MHCVKSSVFCLIRTNSRRCLLFSSRAFNSSDSPQRKGYMKTKPRGQKSSRQMTVINNAGIRHQLTTLDDEDKGVASKFELYEDQSELDIFRAEKLYDRHLQEKAMKEENLKHQIVGHKYFSAEKRPNILTWAEKEHIRYLNSTDSEIHNPETLAENFGVTSDVICKIIKARWLPPNEARIRKHDESVLKKRKELGLPAPKLALPLSQSGELAVHKTSEQNTKERLGPTKFRRDLTATAGRDPLNDTMLEQPIQNSKRVSFSEFKKLNKLSVVETKPTPAASPASVENTQKRFADDVEILKYFDSEEAKRKSFWASAAETVTVNIDEERDSGGIAAYVYDNQRGYQHPYGKLEKTPEKVNAPGRSKGFNGLLRRGDCFYDADGEFLYRVPDLFPKQ